MKRKWVAPEMVVGGLAENPGVFLSGGSVVTYEVDLATGDARVTDYWDHARGLPALKPLRRKIRRGYYSARIAKLREMGKRLIARRESGEVDYAQTIAELVALELIEDADGAD